MVRKFNKSKEWLHEHFIIKQRTSYDIAQELNVTQSCIHFWISKFNLNRNRNSPSKETKEKISNTLKEKHASGELIVPWIGKPLPQWHKDKLSESHSSPEGTSYINNGYRFIKIKGNYIREHHYIWKIDSDWGFIPSGFVVHHINENRLDNRIENLACIPLGVHTTIHMRGD